MKFCKQVVDTYLKSCHWGENESGSAYAPANIALCKYWGKRDHELNLPMTDSLSISLGSYGSHCTISLSNQDAYVLNGNTMEKDSPFAQRLRDFLDLFRGAAGYHYRVEATNTVATSAGFASSASGFAALVLALQQLHGWDLNPRVLSIFARMGSGSASRSLWNGFVHWHAGTLPDGSDSFAEPIPSDWKTLRVGLLTIDAGRKVLPSREAMNRTVISSALYASWPQQVQHDLITLQQAIAVKDFDILGACAEQNAMAMHATMLAARPPVLYWQSATVAALHSVWRARSDGLRLYCTMDAGPNVKLLFTADCQDAVCEQFPEMQVANPWVQ